MSAVNERGTVTNLRSMDRALDQEHQISNGSTGLPPAEERAGWVLGSAAVLASIAGIFLVLTVENSPRARNNNRWAPMPDITRRRGYGGKRDIVAALVPSGACAAVIGLMLLTAPAPAPKAQPPTARCLAISKAEYDGAKRDKLLHVRFGAYVKTGALWQRAYWYCRD